MKNATRENRIVKDIQRLFNARRSIETSLVDIERQVVEKFKGETKAIDSSAWNDYGIWFLRSEMYSDAERVYERLLRLNRNLEEKFGRLHKGLALYNMGIAQIKQRNFDQGIQNILKAYMEDVTTHGKIKAEEMLAYKLKDGLSDFISKVIDNNWLGQFNKGSQLSVGSTFDLMKNMEEAEKLLFVKTINAAKSLEFHLDVYTQVVLFDNLKNLAMLLEYNIRRRSKKKLYLTEVDQIFPSASWTNHFKLHKRTLTHYINVKDFESKIKTITTLSPSTNASDNFLLRAFLTTALIRNFAAHYLDENIEILSDEKKYNHVFSQVVFALLYTLSQTF